MPAALPSAASLTRSAASRVVCRQVASAAELADHFAIRHRIFVDEQAIFTGSDLDLHDHDTSAVALIGYCDGVAAGTVRLFALDPADGIWQGDRLAVLAPYRTRGLGAPLVRCAVATAGGARRSTDERSYPARECAVLPTTGVAEPAVNARSTRASSTSP